jgi:DNA (cytosine-5)-methyltransferase 1
MNQPSLIDIFCGAGGFSEGFRQQGFNIIMGIDSWEPAIKTFNHNFDLNCPVRNVLEFEYSLEKIDLLPDTDVIIGSPPCVTFSSSNKSGKADKAMGIRLTEVFLKIVAIKKYQKNSVLKAWFMENVVNSRKHLNDYYTFEDLGLKVWALKNNLDPSFKAIILKDNQPIINASDYGSVQSRRRVISGEYINKGEMIIPPRTNMATEETNDLPTHLPLKYLKANLPSPINKYSEKEIVDPFYSDIIIKCCNLSDHFYDTGIYECEWSNSQYHKVNHPFMGKMSFPEDENRPSRTITATKIVSSREAIIYKSEFTRKGNGEYRIPTVRESACIMGFPITYQFLGTEGVKYKLVGNAVCPAISRALAKQFRKEYGLEDVSKPIVRLSPKLENVNNLNSYKEKTFDKPPKKIKGARFRRHPFKDGNLTVTLSNYDISKNEKSISKWMTSVQYGNGDGFPTYSFPDGFYKEIEQVIERIDNGKKFLSIINNGFTEKIGDKYLLQEMFEIQQSVHGYYEPSRLVDEVALIIQKLEVDQEVYNQDIFFNRPLVPIKQIFALYAINKIATLANI